MSIRALLVACAAGLGVGAFVIGTVGTNFRTVVPDRIYRSAQLDPGELEERIERHGIRSVLNLRGPKEDRDWYRREVEVVERHELAFRSIDLVPERLPSRPALVSLIDALDDLPEPVLIHCAAGADRTGFASVVARMSKENAPFDEARKQLSFRFGHVPFGPSSEIGRIFDLYESHLRESGASDRFETFDRWAREIYVPYSYHARIEADGLPSEVEVRERMDLRVRALNASPEGWVFTTEKARGIKLGVRLRKDGEWLDYDRHGNFAAAIAPGEEVALEVSIWAPVEAGVYTIKLDLVDEHVTWFEDQGSEPFVRLLRVRESESDPSF